MTTIIVAVLCTINFWAGYFVGKKETTLSARK
jgi:hypothetical protein